MKLKKEKKKNKSSTKWIIQITVLAFGISLLFSFLSETLLPNVPLIIGILLLIVVIGIGIVFDMIGVAVTTANEKSFHSMSAKGLKYAKVAVVLKKNADKVSSFCNDVIGDICGIISGSAGAIISSTLSTHLHWNLFLTTLIVMAFIASFTIGGKALGKGVAIKKSEKIVQKFCKVLSIFYSPKN